MQLLAPVEPGSKVLAAGATYAKHVAGLGLKMPEKPAAFLKPYESLIGPTDDILYPPITEQLDFEVELVVVIGAPVRRGDPGCGQASSDTAWATTCPRGICSSAAR